MPKSKRDKKVSLTKTTKKGLKAKQQLVEEIRNCVEKFRFIYVFTIPNMRNSQLKSIRANMKQDSRFFFGKNKVMTLGLGKKKSEEVEKDLHLVSKYLKGQCGLLFTNKPKEEVIQYFNNYIAYDYPRSGFLATETVVLPEGPLLEFPHSMEPQLRQLGLSTSLQKGIVSLTKEHIVCNEGKPLTPQQARILKLIDKKMAEFRVSLLCMWSKEAFISFNKSQLPDESVDSGCENEESMDED